MKPLHVGVLILLGVILAAVAGFMFYSFYVVVEVIEVPMDIKVAGNYGLNLDVDAMHFGKITSPGYAERGLNVHNYHDKDLLVDVYVSGDMAPWTYVNGSSFVLPAKESKTVMMSMNVPGGVPEGNYTGAIKVMFRRIILG